MDTAIEIIRMRRALPEPASSAAQFGEDPEEGIRLSVPSDDQYWLTLKVVDDPTTDSETHWELAQVMEQGRYLPIRVTVLSTGSQERILAEVDTHYRRLLLERRNAACGTPTRA